MQSQATRETYALTTVSMVDCGWKPCELKTETQLNMLYRRLNLGLINFKLNLRYYSMHKVISMGVSLSSSSDFYEVFNEITGTMLR